MKCALVTAEIYTKAPVGERESIFIVSDDGKSFLLKIGDLEKEFFIDEFIDALQAVSR
jgi:L-asparaginase II